MSYKTTQFLLGLAIIALLVSPTLFLNANAETSFKVKDGDSFYLGSDEIRLWGIDAPELFQKCSNASGKPYSCGRVSKEFLQNLLSKHEITCEAMPKARRETRKVAKCFIDGQDIAQTLLSQGMAVEYDYFSKNFYDKYEQIAKTSKLGIWAGSFDNPRDWRKDQKKYK